MWKCQIFFFKKREGEIVCCFFKACPPLGSRDGTKQSWLFNSVVYQLHTNRMRYQIVLEVFEEDRWTKTSFIAQINFNWKLNKMFRTKRRRMSQFARIISWPQKQTNTLPFPQASMRPIDNQKNAQIQTLKHWLQHVCLWSIFKKTNELKKAVMLKCIEKTMLN